MMGTQYIPGTLQHPTEEDAKRASTPFNPVEDKDALIERLQKELGEAKEDHRKAIDHLLARSFRLSRMIEQVEALSGALGPFADVVGEDDDEYPDNAKVELKYGRTTHYALTLGDLRRANEAIRSMDGGGK